MTTWTLDIIEVGVIPSLPYTIYVPDAPSDRLIDVPCYTYLLTSPAHCVLVDSGPDTAAASVAGFEVIGDARTALTQALQSRNRTPNDVDILLHTHLHYDHMQNDDLFPYAVIVVNEREIPWANSGQDRFYVGVETFLNAAKSRLRLIDRELDLLDGIRILPNGGHTPGHQSVLVTTESGPTCLCADIIPLADNRSILPPSLDPAATRAFMDRIRESSWTIVPGHDPDTRWSPHFFR